jgi:hypothetical protein
MRIDLPQILVKAGFVGNVAAGELEDALPAQGEL